MYSKSTDKLGLPQWEADNHPEFQTDMNDAFKKIDETYGKIKEDTGQLPEQVANLSDIVTSQQEDITELRNDVSDNQVSIANLKTLVPKVGATEERVDTLEATTRVIRNDIDTLIGHVASESNKITSLEGRMDDVEEKAEGNGNSISEINTKFDAHISEVNTLKIYDKTSEGGFRFSNPAGTVTAVVTRFNRYGNTIFFVCDYSKLLAEGRVIATLTLPVDTVAEVFRELGVNRDAIAGVCVNTVSKAYNGTTGDIVAMSGGFYDINTKLFYFRIFKVAEGALIDESWYEDTYSSFTFVYK